MSLELPDNGTRVDPSSVNQSLTRAGLQRKRMRMACYPCSTAKVSCDSQRPCSRCVKKGIQTECLDRPEPLKRTKRRRKSASTSTSRSSAEFPPSSDTSISLETEDGLFQRRVERKTDYELILQTPIQFQTVGILSRHGYKRYSPLKLKDVMKFQTMKFHRFMAFCRLYMMRNDYEDFRDEVFRSINNVSTGPEDRELVRSHHCQMSLLDKGATDLKWSVNPAKFEPFELKFFKEIFGDDAEEQVKLRKIILFRTEYIITKSGQRYNYIFSSNVPTARTTMPWEIIAQKKKGEAPTQFTPMAMFNLMMEDTSLIMKAALKLAFSDYYHSGETFVTHIRLPSGLRSPALCAISTYSNSLKDHNGTLFAFRMVDPEQKDLDVDIGMETRALFDESLPCS